MKTKASFSAPLFALILYVLLFASRFAKDQLIGAGGNVYLSVIILQILIFIIPAIVFCRLKGVGYAVKLNIKFFSPSKLGCVIMSGLVLICLSILIRFLQVYLFGMREFHFSLFDAYLSEGSPEEFLFTATAFAVVPALTEEFVYRTILMTEYSEEGFGAVTTALVTSLLSSMMCFSFETLPIRFAAAVMFCTVTYITGSSLAAFLSHIIFNIYGVFGEKYILKAIVDPSNKIISIFTFTLLFLVLAIILFGEFEHILRRAGKSGAPSPAYLLKKDKDGKTPDVAATARAEENEPSATMSEAARLGIEAFFSPTFLLCVLVFVIAIFGFI